MAYDHKAPVGAKELWIRRAAGPSRPVVAAPPSPDRTFNATAVLPPLPGLLTRFAPFPTAFAVGWVLVAAAAAAIQEDQTKVGNCIVISAEFILTFLGSRACLSHISL